MDKTQVILVDTNDRQIGTMDKMEAHEKALLHRAISVFICNTKGEWLLQRRALDKYHSGGLWTNTCCSHPYPGETDFDAAERRLMQEMGIDCPIYEIFSFKYKEDLGKGLIENELDHVFLGITDEKPEINMREIMEWKYMKYNDIAKDIELNPGDYTAWFKKIHKRVYQYLSAK